MIKFLYNYDVNVYRKKKAIEMLYDIELNFLNGKVSS